MYDRPVGLDEPDLQAISLSTVMQALGDDVRLQIVQTLARDDERQCGTLDLGVTKATRSHHFKVLREAGVTHTRVEGTRRFVSLRRDDLDVRFPGLLDALLAAQAVAV
jgi:DNA-binding transcriptional ArsR family regulator